MIFNSLAYALFFTVTRLFGTFSRSPALIFLIASGVFYIFAGALDTTIFALLLILNWMIAKHVQSRHIRITLAVILNIGVLVFFKYAHLLTGLTSVGISDNSYLNMALPLGISFYTFQSLAYHIDVTREKSQDAKSFAHFALFISFFPQLIAGPIVRKNELMPQINRLFDGIRRKPRLVSFGLSLIILGLFKKVILADSIAPHVDEIFMLGPESLLWA